MKYKKGTFVVIPNKQYLKGKPSEMQSIYFWLCEHADDMGGCYPTKNTLGEEAGCSHNTTDKYLKQLVDEGFIQITQRRKKNSMEFMSNHYQVLVLNHNPNLVRPSTKSELTCPPNNGSETNPSINEPNLTTKLVSKETPFIFLVELEKLGNSTWRVDKIIYNYWIKKGFKFENRKQFDSARKRELRPAKALEGYSSLQINKTMEYCEGKYKDFGWSLETVIKRINQNG